MVLASSVINRWFYQRRGLALGIAGSAMSAGQLIFTPILMQLNMDVGWRSSVAFIVVMLGIIVLPALWLFMRDAPEDLEILPYGTNVAVPAGPGPNPNPMRNVIKSGQFWLLATSFFV